MTEPAFFQGILPHLAELRRRLLWCVLAVCVGAGLALWQYTALLTFLLKPLQDIEIIPQVVVTGATDVFFLSFRLAFYAGLAGAVPVWVYHIYQFSAPGLNPPERVVFRIFMVGTPLLFYAGVLFAYTVIVPLALQFFWAYGVAVAPAWPTLLPYVGIVLKLLFSFGIAFTVPMLVLVLLLFNIVKIQTLRKGRRWVIVGLCVAAAILTPPDPISMILLAIPLYVLFELALFVASRLLPAKN